MCICIYIYIYIYICTSLSASFCTLAHSATDKALATLRAVNPQNKNPRNKNLRLHKYIEAFTT